MGKKAAPTNGAPKTVGPVADLERHLPSDWWRTLFNSIYLKTDGDVVENNKNTAQEIDMLVKHAGLQLNDRILDLCCGQGRHSLELARRGFKNVTGVDRSRYLIRLAKKRARKEGVPVNFHEGDARKFRLPENSFHCVSLMGNSFGYFDREEDDVQVLEAVKRVLVPSGLIVMDLADGEWIKAHFDKRSWEWIDEDHFVCRERSLSADGRRLISREVVVHAEKGVIADQFYAERLYTREQIKDLLESTGFGSVRFFESVATDSTRDQDLGMMAHRMFLTSRAPREVSLPTRSSRAPVFSEITVVMGDPNLSDPVKREGQFNPEDFETINKLKDALNELPGYTYKYVSNHVNLMNELRDNPPQFVFNLCDEGYMNDPFMELHVPATMDMLGIPYTRCRPGLPGLVLQQGLGQRHCPDPGHPGSAGDVLQPG